MRVIPESLIERNNNKINATIEQLLENRTIKEYRKEERQLVELRQLEELETELIRKQKLDRMITNMLTEMLTRNKERDKDKYVFYTDGALYKKREENDTERIGISWVQVGEENNWPEEEIALRLEGWPSATIAELAAIWTAILTVPEGKNIELHTDSMAALRNINRVVQEVGKEKILKKKNAMWIMNITGLIKSKNIKIDIVKVKSHSEDKWNDRADSLAKKGANSKNTIYAEKVKCDKIRS